MRAAIYVGVSTADQNSDLQIRDLQEFAVRRGPPQTSHTIPNDPKIEFVQLLVGHELPLILKH